MPKVDKELHRVLITDSPSLSPMIEHFLKTKGKGTRPLLVLLCGEVVSAPKKRSIDLAVAVELLHMASLVHDDIVDKADIRRRQATIHRLWGEGSAVLLGDYFFGKMLTVISSYPLVVPHFADLIQNLVTGEFMQADQQYNPRITEEEYLNRIYHKTANFIATCCKISCLPNDTPLEITEALTNFGYYLGMAYQLLDDLQDIVETPTKIGKPVMQDISRGIFTLPYLHAYRRTSACLSSNSTYRRMLSDESIAYTMQFAAHYIQKSVHCLSVLPHSDAKTGLTHIALQLKEQIEQLQEANHHAPSLD